MGFSLFVTSHHHLHVSFNQTGRIMTDLKKSAFKKKKTCLVVFCVGTLPFPTDSGLRQVHTPVRGANSQEQTKHSDVFHHPPHSLVFLSLSILFFYFTFGLSFHLSSRRPRFDPAIFSVWCTIIRPSLYSLSLSPTFQSFSPVCYSL